jgi:hypothetical protein
MSTSGTMRFASGLRSGTALRMIWKVGPSFGLLILGFHTPLERSVVEVLVDDEVLVAVPEGRVADVADLDLVELPDVIFFVDEDV